MNKPQLPNFLHNIQIILVRPSHPGNIGSAARAMKTMGLTQLCLVAPQTTINDEARALSSGAVDVLSHAQIVQDLSEALSETTIACALTSRRRELTAPLATPRQIMPELTRRASQGQNIAFVFGNETFGLSIEEVQACNRLITIPGNPDYFSLNLAMAVQVISYELFSHTDSTIEYLSTQQEGIALGELSSFCQHLEQTMEISGYLAHRQNRERLMRRMQTLFQRADLTREEVDILRGFFKQVQFKSAQNP